jgi:hypothetical protein
VTDLFAVLDLNRSAWLDAADIKERHHALMATGSTSTATLLNEARRTLQNPALRIRHFLALEYPDFAPTSRPHQDWEFFLKVGQATRDTSELAAKKSSLSHPLARAALQKEILAKNESLRLLKAEIKNRLADCENRLRISAGPEILTALAEEFAFLQKNENSVREALLALDQGLA